MSRRITVGLLAAALVASGWGGFSIATAHAAGPGKPPAGKVTPWEAMRIATGKVPGRALNANFEFDEGHWVYGVFVVSGKSIKEVEIDPMTGKVGAVENVDPQGEAKELVEMLNAAISGKPAAENQHGEKDEKK